jgi:rubrerythrin
MEKYKVFMIMPFEEKFFEVYEMLKIQFRDKYDFSNAGEEGNQQNILKDIIQPIFETDIVIADLTGLNANVMYELGIAHTFNKKTIVITQDDLSILPFDLKQYRAKDYKTHFKKFAELIEYLKSNLDGAIIGSVSYSNPVKDFLLLEKIEFKDWFSEKPSVVIEDSSDKGFLDFLADIEGNTETLATDIQTMIKEMSEMSEGISKSTSEIKRVNKSGGSGMASFVRKETKKAAKFIEDFSAKLRGHNRTISSLWDKIEKDTLGLLENKYASNHENKQHLITYLKSLHNMQDAITGSNDSVLGLKAAMEGNIGIERSMNQAITFIKDDLSTYLTIIERMNTSIDKIIEKSKYVVGTINYDSETAETKELELAGAITA